MNNSNKLSWTGRGYINNIHTYTAPYIINLYSNVSSLWRGKKPICVLATCLTTYLYISVSIFCSDRISSTFKSSKRVSRREFFCSRGISFNAVYCITLQTSTWSVSKISRVMKVSSLSELLALMWHTLSNLTVLTLWPDKEEYLFSLSISLKALLLCTTWGSTSELLSCALPHKRQKGLFSHTMYFDHILFPPHVFSDPLYLTIHTTSCSFSRMIFHFCFVLSFKKERGFLLSTEWTFPMQ